MRFLCLHGAINNVDIMMLQLAPLQKHLECDNAASFHYVNGLVSVTPPSGFDRYFGIGPHYRWLDDGGIAEESLISRVRHIPLGDSPEDVMRGLIGGRKTIILNYKEVMDYLYNELEKDSEIEGLIGYSEGAGIAATFILEEQQREKDGGGSRRIKCAMFVNGWPPVSRDRGVVLSDEVEDMIDIPTLHVIGSDDPFKHGSCALYNICDPDLAEIFDTGKGHTMPRSGQTITELGDAVRDLIGKTKCSE
ncbi:hypothetical protein Aspvir_006057 [Aspergillus viridinutans]|uniref:Serine hydrolase domain-containing protein n=1 Tax=Aspergillus viridinutans TaxID=75553 RepID=A0A9P3BTK0_ASPVI|nr:uncharacterized protein Aspvir_006057 [Aspergillus viridinutans]GIK02014.1 hypothetical protein Aspvir_006057 [Aspergillus viridinutans]